MPGIHIHAISQLNWLDQEESLLTVPGSYWLYHKKNIYKFIFKYHRTARNTTRFLYGRELLKIIRRIIKCHPTQGQQFGTQHLLVTYNCTSWTRQDKMFAILKFQQRSNAAAYSHAFVLTIKICSEEEQSIFDLRYPIVREANAVAAFKNSDDTVDIDVDEKATVIQSDDKEPPRKSKVHLNKRINQILKHSEDVSSMTSAPINSTLQNNIVQNSAISREKSDRRVKSATTCNKTDEVLLIDEYNTKLGDNTCVNKSTNCNSGRSEKDTKKSLVFQWKVHSRAAKKKDEIQVGQADDDDVDVNVKQLWDENDSDEDSTQKERVNDNDEAEEIAVDSSKTPHRHFIKKDVDNVKQGRARSTISPPVLDKSVQQDSQQGTSDANNANFVSQAKGEKVEEESTRKEERDETADKSPEKRLASTSTRAADDRAQSTTYSKWHRTRKQRNWECSERKTVADDKLLRSSNITDLVMEGLMFTIRQGQDSVAVIEQKTKLEVDEVLENSEKAETEAGEKCLLNSSLLGLENLVTMIDPPRDKDEQHKISHNVIGNSAYSSPLIVNVNNAACHLDDIDYVNGTTNKLSIPDYERCNIADQLSPCRFRRQQQRVYSNIANNGNRDVTEEQSMEWESDDKRNEECAHQSVFEITNEEEIEEVVEMVDKEEDIVPDKFFHSTILSPEKANVGLPSTEFPIDKTDVEEANKWGTSIKDHDESSASSFCLSSSFNKVSTSETPTTYEKKSGSDKQEVSVPRVISNKSITVDQMPLALQKMLRHTRRFPPTTAAGKTPPAHDDQRAMQSATSAKNVASETSISDQPIPHEVLWQQQQVQSDIADSDSYSANRNAIEKRQQSMEWENDDGEQDEECMQQSASSEENRDVHPGTASEPIVEVTDDAEETRNEVKDESCVTIDFKDDAEIGSDDARHTVEKNKNETRRTPQTILSEIRTRHGSPRKLQDITEDFYHDLHAYKSSATQQRCLRQRRRSLNGPEDIKNGKMRIEMFKFIQDMTEGAKVVLRRLNMDNKSNISQEGK